MKILWAILLLTWPIQATAQVLAKVKSRVDRSVARAKSLAPARPAASHPTHERKLIEADNLKTMLQGIAKEYLWTVGDPADNVILVSEKVGDADVPIFKATLTEIEVKGSTEKRQILTLENRPKDAEDAQFGRYKHSHTLFRRKVSAKDATALPAFIRNCGQHFKALIDRLKALNSANGLLDVVKQVIDEIKMPGVSLVVSLSSPLNAAFQVKDASGVRYHGSIYRVSADYIGLALWSSDEFVQVYSGKGTEANFKARLTYILKTKLVQRSNFLRIADIKDKVLAQVRARCPADVPQLKATTLKESLFATDLAAAQGASQNSGLNSCIYANSKLLILQYSTGKIQYFHFYIDIKELTTEDVIAPNAQLFDPLLTQSFTKNQNTVMFIRQSRLKSKSEVTADEDKIKAALVAAIGGQPTEVSVDGELKSAVEVNEQKWLHEWSFAGGVTASLFQNEADFIVQVAKVNAKTKSIATTQIVIPVFNGYDHLGLLKMQVAEFVAGN